VCRYCHTSAVIASSLLYVYYMSSSRMSVVSQPRKTHVIWRDESAILQFVGLKSTGKGGQARWKRVVKQMGAEERKAE